MATYAIGDVQGCYAELRRLLDTVKFDTHQDRLVFVGDLVNRGPQSLEVLRLVQNLGDRALTVLGNHDLHLLTVASGLAKVRADDTLDGILTASDRDELLDWLRHRPLMIDLGAHASGYVVVHAGLLPAWSITTALALADEVAHALRAPRYPEFLGKLYGSRPDRWSDSLGGHDRLRVIVNAMTRMRFCSADGVMEFHSKGEASAPPPGYLPWFDVPTRAATTHAIVCGHWSALGLHVTGQVFLLDTGCVWGGALTALRLEDRAIFQVQAARR